MKYFEYSFLPNFCSSVTVQDRSAGGAGSVEWVTVTTGTGVTKAPGLDFSPKAQPNPENPIQNPSVCPRLSLKTKSGLPVAVKAQSQQQHFRCVLRFHTCRAVGFVWQQKEPLISSCCRSGAGTLRHKHPAPLTAGNEGNSEKSYRRG